MAKTKEELISMIENDLVDPSTNKITGERVKNALTEMVDAMGTGGGGAMEYWRVPENFNQAEEEDLIFAVASQMKWKTEEMTYVGSPFLYAIFNLFPSAFSVNMSAFMGGGQLYAVTDYIAQSGIDLEARGYTRITEEEFYAV